MGKEISSFRPDIYEYVGRKYKSGIEYLWARYPNYAVFRRSDNNKWYGIIMDIPREKLGLSGYGKVDILNVKLDNVLEKDMLIQEKGILKGYHISRGNWISILLDGTVPLRIIENLIDKSYSVTASAKAKRKERSPKEWIIPANPKYYDIERAFDNTEEINWKQGSGIIAGDTVFLYAAAPVSAILYKCRVTETDIPYSFRNENLNIKALMKIKLIKKYPPDIFTFSVMKDEFGIYAIRGPRGITDRLSLALNDKTR